MVEQSVNILIISQVFIGVILCIMHILQKKHLKIGKGYKLNIFTQIISL